MARLSSVERCPPGLVHARRPDGVAPRRLGPQESRNAPARAGEGACHARPGSENRHRATAGCGALVEATTDAMSSQYSDQVLYTMHVVPALGMDGGAWGLGRGGLVGKVPLAKSGARFGNRQPAGRAKRRLRRLANIAVRRRCPSETRTQACPPQRVTISMITEAVLHRGRARAE